ncbi:MAG TPA: hypothetical protein DDW50_09265 [Firmicutes bacterium]|jgi:hypothetical protein|nr:hypothetical protein [Bacillota bacterium]
MMFPGRKKTRILLLLMTITIMSIIFVVIRNGIIERNNKISEQKMVANLLHLQEPGWEGYTKLDNGFTGFLQKWNIDTRKKQTGDSELAENNFIRSEFDHQISEIKRISDIEENLKLSEIHETFQNYVTKRRSTLDNEFQKKVINMEEALKSELIQKKLETKQQLHDFEKELLSEQQLNLVNLQLQFALSDLKDGREEFNEPRNKIQAKMNAIKTEIAREVAAKRELLDNQFMAYEKQRTKEVHNQLDNLKLKLDSQLENDLAAFKANLNQNYDDWRQIQSSNFAKAIDIRQQQKKN